MIAAVQAPGQMDLERIEQSVVFEIEEDGDIWQGVKVVDVIPTDPEVAHPIVASPRGVGDETAAIHAVHHALAEPVVASRVSWEALLDAAREVHGIVGLDLVKSQGVWGDVDLFEVFDLGD